MGIFSVIYIIFSIIIVYESLQEQPTRKWVTKTYENRSETIEYRYPREYSTESEDDPFELIILLALLWVIIMVILFIYFLGIGTVKYISTLPVIGRSLMYVITFVFPLIITSFLWYVFRSHKKLTNN